MANLLDNLKSRFNIAEKFSKDYQEQVKQAVKDYKAETPVVDLDAIDTIKISEGKYKLVYPLIFINHEAMMASMFDRIPELIVSGKGKDDEVKALKIEASYKYISDKLSLEWFLNDSAWWFILAGMASSHASYNQQTKDVPLLDEMGQPQLDPMTQEPMMRKIYEYDDPVIEVDDPLKVYYSPESEFSVKFDKVPYLFYKKLMDVNEVKRVFNKEVESDATIDIKDDKKTESTDLKRVQMYFYYGNVPKENKGEVQDWQFDANYYIVYSEKKLIHQEKIKEKMCRGLKLHGVPNEFFGFGLAKLLKASQTEKSTRRSQQIRYADVMSMPKLAQDETASVDESAVVDPRVGVIVTYSDKKPEYLVPPTMPETLMVAEQHVDSDAQQISGLMDLSTASQQTTTDTATGQQIFADAAEKRVKTARRKLLEYYKQNVIMLLKLAQEKWDTEKVVSITDDKGQQLEVTVAPGDLSDIDFDKDIEIDGESMTLNKDVLRQQSVELYNITKDDPLAERTEILKDVMKDGFGKNNPDKYVAKPTVQPGTQLTSQTGEAFTVDQTGKLVPAQQQQTIAPPTQGVAAATTPAGLSGAVNNIGG